MNGSIEVWDLLERTNEPAMVQSISSTAITSIQLKIITSRQHLLAISDASGTVHILQVPYILLGMVGMNLDYLYSFLQLYHHQNLILN